MARTEQAPYTFVVQEFGDGTPWITVEPSDDSPLSILEHGIFALHLKPETEREEAEEIARRLNEAVDRLSFTNLKDMPHAPGT